MLVPIKRRTEWVLTTINKNVEKGYKSFPINRLINELNLKSFQTSDFLTELDWVRLSIKSLQSPICFSHNDFRGNNILVSQELDVNYNQRECLLFCDFESSGYGYRGSDFGTLFAEWNRTDSCYTQLQDFPKDSEVKPFIDEYIREWVAIVGDCYLRDERNNFEHILKEVKLFTLVSYVFMLSACLAIDGYKQMGITKRDLMV